MVQTEESAAKRMILLGSEFPPGPGGIGTHAYQLALHLSQRGWQVAVLTPQAYVSEATRDAFNGRQPFSVTTLPERASGRDWWQKRLQLTARTVESIRPDIMVASGRRALWTAAGLQQRFRIPWVAVGHGSEFVGQSALARLLTVQAIKRAAAVVAVSEYTARLIGEMTVPARLVVIPNGADGERFRPRPADPALAHRLGAAGKKVVLTVGHVSERKAQDVVIRALPRVAEACPDVVYVMVGLPSRRDALQSLAVELGVSDRIVFAGAVADDELPDYYNLADLFVLVSRRAAGGDVEGYGIVVKEAALSGKPAVVSQGCGLTEAIVEGVTGISVPPDDPAATARAITQMLADDTRREAMGGRAREQAATETWAHRVDAYDDLLQDVAQQNLGIPVASA